MNFLTIVVLICSSTNNKIFHCYEKGSKSLREIDIESKTDMQYTKCDPSQKSCSLTKWDGCVYKLRDGTIIYSGYTCQ